MIFEKIFYVSSHLIKSKKDVCVGMIKVKKRVNCLAAWDGVQEKKSGLRIINMEVQNKAS
jgi:hypothetical protein